MGCWLMPWEGSLGVFYCTFIRLFYVYVGTIRIEQKGQGVALYAPGHGLQEVYYSSDQWKVRHNLTDQKMGSFYETVDFFSI